MLACKIVSRGLHLRTPISGIHIRDVVWPRAASGDEARARYPPATTSEDRMNNRPLKLLGIAALVVQCLITVACSSSGGASGSGGSNGY